MAGGAVGVVLIAAMTGCGTGQRAGEATAVARRFAEAVQRQDGAAACALLSPPARERLDGPCAEVLPRLGLRPGDPETATVWGDAAQVRAAPDTLFLGEYAAGWRVTGAGCRPRGEGVPYDCELGGA
jgi:hypothetical protein